MTPRAVSAVRLALPQLRPDQWLIVQHPAKLKIVAMGRRWGKSVTGQVISISAAFHGLRVAWVVPTYKNSRPLWREVEKALAPLKKARLCEINRSERTVSFPNGGFLAIYSMDNPDSIRGENFDIVIVDEAAMIPESAWFNCIQPTLADNDGDCILISTPKGRNWFWKEWTHAKAHMEECARTGQTPRYAAFTATSRANPNPNIQRAFDLARTRVPEATYRQEWCAEFLEDGGTVFRRVKKYFDGKRLDPYAGTFVAGLDWGRSVDYSVLTIQDADTGRVVDWLRFNEVGWAIQRGHVRRLCDRWGVTLVLAEENSVGGPNIEALQDEGLPVLGFNTNRSTKGRLINSYVLSMERGEIRGAGDEDFIIEHEAFESSINKLTGHTTYSAPGDGHDDTVISGALADWARLHLGELLELLSQLRDQRAQLVDEDEYEARISEW